MGSPEPQQSADKYPSGCKRGAPQRKNRRQSRAGTGHAGFHRQTQGANSNRGAGQKQPGSPDGHGACRFDWRILPGYSCCYTFRRPRKYA